ncbi:MAG: tetratricopeptide repeat protein [Alphaproteobacteria bacterium]|nr:tetratricopeptide repeat protein [Alphaproteobacteria bacterium]
MAHIILKTMKTGRDAKQAPPTELAAMASMQPMVIDFSKHRSRLISAKIIYGLFGALASFLLTSLLALFILGEQINHLWREAQHVTADHVKIVTKKSDEPESAFPAATITPLPSKAFIMGKDFQKNKSSGKIDLVPILEKLPVYGQPTKPIQHRGSFVEVETAVDVSKSTSLQAQADDAIASGQTNKGIDLYIRAVRLSPGNTALRSNAVALLLEQARSYDELGDVPNAIAAYKKAQGLWQGDVQTARSIKARIDFLEQN